MFNGKKIILAAVIFLSGCSAIEGGTAENDINSSFEVCGEEINLQELVKEENYYTTDEYCFLALSDGDESEPEARKYSIGDDVNGLLLSQARTVFYLGNDPSGFEEQLYVDLISAVFSGRLTLTGNLYRVPEGPNTGICFTPDSDEWKGLPLIYGKTDKAAPNFRVRNAEDSISAAVPNDGTSVRAKVTIDNLCLKWNNGSASESPDTAEIIAVDCID